MMYQFLHAVKDSRAIDWACFLTGVSLERLKEATLEYFLVVHVITAQGSGQNSVVYLITVLFYSW